MRPAVFSFDRYPKQVPPETSLVVAEAEPNDDQHKQPEHMLQSPLAPSFQTFHGLLQAHSDRECIFAELGIEELILQSYNDDFVKVDAQRFMSEILEANLGAKLIVTGSDYRFGMNQGGNIEILHAWAKERGIRAVTVDPVLMNNEIVSSSLIREKVVEGAFDEVRALLGRGYTMKGVVIRGNALGRTVGMPTANIRVPEGQVIPPYGVYLTRTRVGHLNYPSVTNIGMRPTVNQTDPRPLIETCLLDVNINLYDSTIEVEFIRYMRPELKFPSFLAMTAQIHQDIQNADAEHARLEQPWKYAVLDRSIPFYVRNSERFSQCTLDIVSLASLASRILVATAPGYDTRTELAEHLDYNYDAMISSEVFRRGDLAVVSFHCSAIRLGADGSKPFNRIAELLMRMIVSPRLDEDGLLPENILASEKQNLLMEIRSLESNRDYTSLRNAWRASLPAEDPRSLLSIGDSDIVRGATAEAVTAMWQELLTEWEMKVYIAGDVQTETLKNLRGIMETIPSSEKRFRQVPGVVPTPFELDRVVTLEEEVPGEQAVIVLLFGGLPVYTSVHTLGGLLLNMLIGGGPHSRLFEVLREQRGLCYSVDSHYSLWNNTIVVQARVHRDDVEEATAVILEEVEAIASGDFTEREFVSSRLLVEADILGSGDSLADMATFVNEAQTAGRDLQVEEILMALRSLDPEIIPRIARNLELKTQYVALPPQEEGEDS